MGRTPRNTTEQEFLEYLRQGRDEMNLLEHSISGANKRVDRTTRSLVFSQWATDPETGEPVPRSWKVTFSAEFGRPTPKDDDVFVALMKKTQAVGLMDRNPGESAAPPHPQVHFTSYELIRILGWPDKGDSYKAIDDALNRLCGVRIVATNYWYDNDSKLWGDRKFGIIEDVFLYERAKYDQAKRHARKIGDANPKSWIRWSDVMVESFQAGYVRKLDIEVYRSLKSPIARKLFRYLGKQFWEQSGKTKHRIDIRDLCHEKLGYPRYDNNKCKEKIAGPLSELEERGLFGLRHEFLNSYGKCDVVFYRTKTRVKRSTRLDTSSIATLIEHGVSRKDALRFDRTHSPERIREDVEDVEFREKNGMVKGSKAGLLFKMLESNEPWSRPKGFVSSIDKKRMEDAAKQKREERERADRAHEHRLKQEREEREAKFEEFIKSLGSTRAREQFAEEALRNESFLRKSYEKNIQQGDRAQAEVYRRTAMMKHWEKSAN